MQQKRVAFKGLKKVWAVSVIALLGCILSTPAAAEDRQKMVYEVYAGGIHAVQASLDIHVRDDGRYDLVMDANTRGFLAKMAPWDGTFESHGWVSGKGNGATFKPQEHKSTAVWRGEKDVKEYLYNKDGSFKSLRITDEHSDRELREIDPAITNGTIDSLTAMLQVLNHYNESGQCTGASEVFDGKRRFNQIFKHEKNEALKASRYNIYEGAAAQCTVEVVPISGAWHKKPRGWMSIQEQGRSKGTMPTVWVAQMQEGSPAIPVKVRVKTGYGTLFMHLAEYNGRDKTLVAEKRVK